MSGDSLLFCSHMIGDVVRNSSLGKNNRLQIILSLGYLPVGRP